MSRFLVRAVLLPILAIIMIVSGSIVWIAEGVGGRLHGRGAVTEVALPAPSVEARARRQAALSPSITGGAPDSQILFGDLHVHTTFSGDAFIFSLPLFQGEGAHPPADACDFARFCSGLDFWSINDHAESLTPRQWLETRESIRECNAVSDPAAPDLVSFLGWEWTQSAMNAEATGRTHYGHKNVMFRDTEEGRVPSRPIGAGSGGLFEQPIPSAAWALLRWGMSLRDLGALGPNLDFNRFTREVRGLETCPPGVPVRDLPEDCLEGAESPELLFEKLNDWGFETLVIPHGTSWGIHAPPQAKLDDQLSRPAHDPAMQRLFETYSGHGSSEVYRETHDALIAEDGTRTCAPPQDGYLPCCWQAGELIRARCAEDEADEVCEARVERTRQLSLESPSPEAVVSGTTADDWLECGQLQDGFLPAYKYRSRMSAQYGLALRAEGGATYRYGLIASSDNHKARAGAGYKELARKAYGDAYGFRRDWYDALADPAPFSATPNEQPSPLAQLAVGFERGASYYYTAGLVAAHSSGRDRESIWQALESRNVYGTSGDRILLWFDLLNGPEGRAAMGSEVEVDVAPRFEVRAAGAFEQRPGCPDPVRERLGAERLRRLCLDECYHPGDTRKRIERIEVVRIRKQKGPNEPVGELIEDPWRIFECEGSPEGCRFEFEDSEPANGRETVYYVRALQEATPAVNGDPVRCERDAEGRCLRARTCPAAGPDFDPQDDCLSPVNERAWSSPIFVRRAL
jgi:hypothetical protein